MSKAHSFLLWMLVPLGSFLVAALAGALALVSLSVPDAIASYIGLTVVSILGGFCLLARRLS